MDAESAITITYNSRIFAASCVYKLISYSIISRRNVLGSIANISMFSAMYHRAHFYVSSLQKLSSVVVCRQIYVASTPMCRMSHRCDMDNILIGERSRQYYVDDSAGCTCIPRKSRVRSRFFDSDSLRFLQVLLLYQVRIASQHLMMLDPRCLRTKWVSEHWNVKRELPATSH